MVTITGALNLVQHNSDVDHPLKQIPSSSGCDESLQSKCILQDCQRLANASCSVQHSHCEKVKLHTYKMHVTLSVCYKISIIVADDFCI